MSISIRIITRMHLKILMRNNYHPKNDYSRLSEEDLTDDDCNKARQIQKHFDVKNMGVYHDLYLQTDGL